MWRRPSAGRLQIDTTMQGRGIVVVSEAYDSGWRATADGVPVPVYPCDVALMAVPVPRGVHRVELIFRPRTWTAALVLFAVGLVAFLVLLRGRRPPAAP